MRVVGGLRRAGLNVEANVPYRTDRTEDFAVPVHGDDRGIPAILVEIRNDHLRDDRGCRDLGDIFE